MMVPPRALAWLLLAPCGLVGQLRLYLAGQPTERLVAATHDLGTFELGPAVHLPFRLRNAGALPARLGTLRVEGAAFSLGMSGPLPQSLEPGAALDFYVGFEPAAPGNYSAFLWLNSQSVLLRAVAVPAPVVSLEHEGRRTVLAPNASVDFGRLERGSAAARRFWLENASRVPVETAVTLSGSAFKLLAGIDSPVNLAPGQALAFDVLFEPLVAGPATGWLRINQRWFGLQGTGLSSFPEIQLAFDPPEIASGRNLRLTVRLASPAQENCTGVAGLDFKSYLPDQADDPAIGFLTSGPSRWETIEVSQGDDTARFGAERGVWVQTGTTIGRIGITVKLCGQEAWVGLEPRPAPVVIDSLKASRVNGNLEVTITGFDNTRSASQLVFSFFDSDGRLVAPGRISLEAGAEFQRFYESSKQGGTFMLRAGFPVAGDASGIAAVEVEITNSAGVTRSERTPLGP
jgi:hypothetical protein